ncbi:DUF4031 domain-containing protein [Nigerium massiliense]|uniref:DUF4031 domain-containing protein n=1 Tax=Nigerium massiliense TaxID=1522317 RepID=UPI0005906D10|nr:DUF4031 domain-containing protein [Nigerium massiliense]
MILIDPPRWPAHGTVYSHLVSDHSLAELHAFAADAELSPRAFDHDHYDVPEARYADLVRRGASEVSATTLVRRLLDSGLRVHAQERTPKRAEVLPRLRGAWAGLMPGQTDLGTELLERWSEPHRHYHDVRHLAFLLDALEELGCDDEVIHLAGWFHDAVYQGLPGSDEEASAVLAEKRLGGVLDDEAVREVARLVRLTAGHEPDAGDERGALLCDADLAILGSPGGRYSIYARDVRLDFESVPDREFARGRRQVLAGLLGRERLFRTDLGRELWEERARHNVTAELAFLDGRA